MLHSTPHPLLLMLQSTDDGGCGGCMISRVERKVVDRGRSSRYRVTVAFLGLYDNTLQYDDEDAFDFGLGIVNRYLEYFDYLWYDESWTSLKYVMKIEDVESD